LQTLQILPFIVPQHFYSPNISSFQNIIHHQVPEVTPAGVTPSVTPAAVPNDPQLIAAGILHCVLHSTKYLLISIYTI